MKTCEEILEALPALAEEVLDAAEAAEIRAHLAGCPECGPAWKRQVLIGRHFRETDLAVRHDYVWMRMRKSILDQSGFGTQRILKSARPRRRALALAIAGVAASLLVVGAYLLGNPGAQASNTDIVKGPPKTPPVKNEPPSQDHQPPVTAANDGKVEDITPPKDEVADKPQDPPAPPSATPEKKDEVVKTQEPKPEKGPVVKDPPKKEDTVAKNPPKDPPKGAPAAPEPPALATLLPGDPRYSVKLTHEQADILLPKGPDSDVPVLKRDSIEQVLALLKVARARLEELKALPPDRKGDAPELIEAYSVLVGEGAAPIIVRMDRAKMSVSPADAELRAQSKILEEMPPEFKKAVQPALIVCDAARDSVRGRRALKYNAIARARTSGALASAREAVSLFTKPEVSFRTVRGFALVDRHQDDLLKHARAGRKPEAELAYGNYEKLLRATVFMVECITPEQAPTAFALASAELNRQYLQFRNSAAPPEMSELIGKAVGLTLENRKRLEELAGRIADRLPKKDEKPPEKKPDPQTPPPPPPKDPPPKFGEDPEPSPPPPPQPPFGEPPK